MEAYMFKRVMTVLSFIVMAAAIVIGGFFWNEKLEETVANAVDKTKELEQQNQPITGKENETEGNTADDSTINRVELGYLVENTPSEIQSIFKDAYDNKKQVKLVLVGSPAMGYKTNGWSNIVEKELEKKYGKNLLDVVIYEYDGTSSEFVEDQVVNEIAELNADIVLFEGLTLEDNGGLIPVETSHENIKSFIDLLRDSKPEVLFIIQPPHPIHAAVNYPKQVEDLKQFVTSQGMIYFDHWTSWPDYNSDEILEYLNQDSMPNENGHQLWANAILDFFVSKKDE